jgi:hypothetical protein
VFSARSFPRLYNEYQLSLPASPCREARSEREVESLQADSQLRVAVVRSEKLVPGAEDISGIQREGNVHNWKPLPNSAVRNVNGNISLYVIVICKV